MPSRVGSGVEDKYIIKRLDRHEEKLDSIYEIVAKLKVQVTVLWGAATIGVSALTTWIVMAVLG